MEISYCLVDLVFLSQKCVYNVVLVLLRQEGIPDLDFEKEGNVEEDVKDHDGQAVQGNPFP